MLNLDLRNAEYARDNVEPSGVCLWRAWWNLTPYTQLVDLNDEDYISKVAWTIDEACKLVEGGFQYVCDFQNAKIFRKPK